jgi:hypothetical protein
VPGIGLVRSESRKAIVVFDLWLFKGQGKPGRPPSRHDLNETIPAAHRGSERALTRATAEWAKPPVCNILGGVSRDRPPVR